MNLSNKFLMLLLPTIFSSVLAFAQAPSMVIEPNSKSVNPELKLKPRLRNNGVAFTCAGLITFITGIALVADADETSYSYTNTNGTVTKEGSPEGGIGSVMIGLGAASSVGGTLMWVFGQKKITREKKRAALSFSLSSIKVSYRF